jgi:hypothetical protein
MDRRRGLPWFVPPLVLAAAIAGLDLAGQDGRSAASAEHVETRKTMGGRTTQGEPITAVVRDGRLVEFDTQLRLQCVGGDTASPPRQLHWRAHVPARGSDGLPTFSRGVTVWQTTWRPRLGPGRTVVDRGAISRRNDHPRMGSAATSTITAELEGETLTGTLLTSITVRTADGSYASCAAGGGRFRLER